MAVKVFKVKNKEFVEYVEQPLVTDDICAYKIVLETDYNLEGHTIRITAKRSDGVIFEDYGNVSGNNAEYVIKSAIYNVSGEVEIRIIIVDSESNCLTDKSLVFEVITSHKSGDMQSATDGGKSVADLALSHIYNTDNPHAVTAEQLGLGNVLSDLAEKAPKRHRSSTDTYGLGSATYYGHLKLSDSTSSTRGESGGIAATPYAVKQAYDLANSANTALDEKADAQNANGGFVGGYNASATGGGAVGNSAYAVYGGAVGFGAETYHGGTIGESAVSTNGGAVGYYAKAQNGFAGGMNAEAQDTGTGGAVGKSAVTVTGGAVGEGASTNYGGAVGYGASSSSGGAVGEGASAYYGGAVGLSAKSLYGGFAGGDTSSTVDGGAVGNGAVSDGGGAVGYGAMTGDGFAGGMDAKTKNSDNEYINAIQLGTGTNANAKTLQVYDYTLMNSDGSIPNERIDIENNPSPSSSKPVASGGVYSALSGKAPTNHRASTNTYGKGDKYYFGHLKLSDDLSSENNTDAGIAATPYAVKQAYDLANSANTRANSAYDLADDVYFSLYTNGYAGGSEVTADLMAFVKAFDSNGFAGPYEVIDTIADLSHSASGEEYNTGKVWLDGSPIYRRDFCIQVVNTSTQWKEKEISWNNLFKLPSNTMLIKSNAKGCVGNFYSDSTELDVGYTDNIDISTTAYGIEWTQDIEYMNSLNIWGYIEYCKTNAVSINSITHKFE